MSDDAGQTVFVILVAIALLGQALVLLAIYFEVRLLVRQVKTILDNCREPIRAVLANTVEVSRILRKQSIEADALLTEAMNRAHVHVDRWDSMLAATTRKTEAAAKGAARGLHAPFREMSAVVRGVREGLRVLFSR